MAVLTCGTGGSTNSEAVNEINNSVKDVNLISNLPTSDQTIIGSINVLGYNTVNDGGGDIFNYDASQSAVNDGGTIINGWVRQYSGAVNPLMFGAIIGSTDNTTAINLMISSGNKNMEFLGDKSDIYMTDGFIISSPDVTISGNATIKLNDNANNSLLWADSNADNFTLKDLYFDGNRDNQTHSSGGTPFGNNAALVLIQGDYPFIDNVKVNNTLLRGIQVCAISDASDEKKKPIVTNCKTNGTGDGIRIVFARSPVVDNCMASFANSKMLQMNSIDVGTKSITMSGSFNHLSNDYIGVYESVKGDWNYLGSIEKVSDISGLTTFTVADLTLFGGVSSLGDATNKYLLSAEATKGHGIEFSNCYKPKIENSSADKTVQMGITITQSRGELGIISNCDAFETGEEGLVIDGGNASKIIGGSVVSCSIGSFLAPAIHNANASPGITEPNECSIVGVTIKNCLAVAINAGLDLGTSPEDDLITANIIYRDPSYNWIGGDSAITSNGNTYIKGNKASGYDNGITIVDGSDSVVQGNTIVGNGKTIGKGVSSINAARTIIKGNNISLFNDATYITDQSAMKISGNTIDSCLNAYTTTKTGNTFESSWVYNESFDTTNLFNGEQPGIVIDDFEAVYQRNVDDDYIARTVGSAFSFTPSNSGYLLVRADDALASPSVKKYSIVLYSGTWVIGEVWDSTESPSIIDVNATINSTSGLIDIAVTGSGTSKACEYRFSKDERVVL